MSDNNYMVVQSSSISELEEQVNKKMADGWLLAGGIQIDSSDQYQSYYYQSMYYSAAEIYFRSSKKMMV